jgi:outer membrane lipoprotein-sorting protein
MRFRRRRGPTLPGCLVFAAAMLCMAASAPGVEDPARAVIDGLRAELGDVQGLRIPYERVILTSSTMLLGGSGAGDHASGHMLFEPPHFLKIVQEAPRRETVIGNGESLWWYIPEKKEVHRYSAEAMGQELQALSDVFRGLRGVEESFEVIWEGHTEKGDRRIRLVPDPPWSQTNAIVLEVTEGCRLRVVEIHNAVGNVTRFTLGPLEKREGFEKGFFTFSPPEGVRVIEEGR